MHRLRNRSTWAALAATTLLLVTAGGSAAVTDEPVADLGRGEAPPVGVIDPDGNETVAWVREGENHDKVVAARRTAGGAWEAPIVLWADGAFSSDLSIGVEDSGVVTVAWQTAMGSPSNRSYTVLTSRYVEDQWTTPFVLAESKNMPGPMDLSVDPGGAAVAAWSSRAGVRAKVRTAEGDWGASTVLSSPDTRAGDVRVGAGGGGSAVVSWRQEPPYAEDSRMMVSRLDGDTWSAPQDMGRGGEASALLVAPDGSATLAWIRGRRHEAVVATRAMSTEGSWSGRVDFGVADAWYATAVGGAFDLDLVGDDGVVLVWPETRGLGPDTRLRVATRTGDEWTVATAFRTDAEVVLLFVGVSWVPDGRLLLTWLQSPYYHQNPAKVRYAVRTDNDWSEPVTVARKRDLFYMSAADHASGRVLLTWLDLQDYYDRRVLASAIEP